MAFARRLLDVTFKKGKGTFAQSGGTGNTVTIKGMRVKAHIQKQGVIPGVAQIHIYGLGLSLMNDLNTLGGRFIVQGSNSVLLYAYDEGKTPSLVFAGGIFGAYTDFSGAPEVPFIIQARAGMADAVLPAQPRSYPGGTDAAAVASSIASGMNLKFENSGVNVKLPSSYFWGSNVEQLEQLRRAANIEAAIDDLTLALWPKGGSRGGQVPLISAETGLVGYPNYTEYGIMFQTLFNPQVALGGKFQLESRSLPPANRLWAAAFLNHELESITPRGKWLTEVGAYDPGQPNAGPVVLAS